MTQAPLFDSKYRERELDILMPGMTALNQCLLSMDWNTMTLWQAIAVCEQCAQICELMDSILNFAADRYHAEQDQGQFSKKHKQACAGLAMVKFFYMKARSNVKDTSHLTVYRNSYGRHVPYPIYDVDKLVEEIRQFNDDVGSDLPRFRRLFLPPPPVIHSSFSIKEMLANAAKTTEPAE